MRFRFTLQRWALCNGQLLLINQNQALFSLLGIDISAASRIISREIVRERPSTRGG
jgi:hypothetical protein